MQRDAMEPARWWIPNGEGGELAGSIEVDGGGEVSVHVHQTLPGLEGIPFIDPKASLPIYPLINGISMGDHWTLIDCRIVSWKNSLQVDVCDIELRPRMALAGEFLLNDLDELTASSVRFALWDQDEWSQWADSLTINPRDDTTGEPLSIRQTPPESIEVSVNGASIVLEDNPRYFVVPQRDRSVRMDASSRWRLEFEQPVALDDFIVRWVEPFVFLTTTGTRRKTGLAFMGLTSSAWKLPSGVRNRWLRLYAQSGWRPAGEISDFGMLHKVGDWDLPNQLPKVFACVANHRFAVDQYLSYRNSKSHTWQTRFATLYQVAESLDRTLDGAEDVESDDVTRARLAALDRALDSEPILLSARSRLHYAIKHQAQKSLAQRFSRMDKRTGRFISRELSNRNWISDLADLRNSVAHGLESAKGLMEDRGPLWTGAELLELLCELRILVEFGFTPEVAATMVKENPRWYSRVSALKANLPGLKALVSKT